MRTLALDIGEVRVGLAVSDSAGKIATPLKVLPADVVLNHGAEFRRIVEDWEIEQLVSGLPMTMAGEEGPQAASIREKAQKIAKACGLPLFFCDERLSSREAKRILREEGLDERAMRGKVDMIAASLIPVKTPGRASFKIQYRNCCTLEAFKDFISSSFVGSTLRKAVAAFIFTSGNA